MTVESCDESSSRSRYGRPKPEFGPVSADFSLDYSPLPAALSPSLSASASLMYLPFLVVP
jgi:hypothetical protein